MDESSGIYLKEKPVRTLITIYQSNSDTFCRKVSKEIDSTYAHTVKIVSRLKQMNVVETEQEGRKKILSLTDMGDKQAELLIELIEVSGKEILNQTGELGEKQPFKNAQ